MLCKFVVLIPAMLLLAHAADVRVIEEIAVKVNGDIITRGDLEGKRHELGAYLEQEQHLKGNALQQAIQDQSQNLLRDEIDTLLLVQRAKDLQISVDADVAREIAHYQVQSKISDPDKFHDYIREQSGMPYEEFRQKILNKYLTQRVIGAEVTQRVSIPEPELQKYYDEHKTDYVRKEQVFLSQILISTDGKTPEQAAAAELKAKDLVARARKGEKFSELASANSDDTETSKNGGQLPGMQREQLEPSIAAIVFKEKKGFITDPIKLAAPLHGFLILKIEERFDAGQASFDEVKDQIQEIMAGPQMEPKVRELLTRLRKEAFLEIRDGYVDSGAAPGKDTRWHEVAQLKPQTTTKEEVASHNRKKFLGLIPHGSARPMSTSAAPDPTVTPVPAAPIKQ